MPKLGALVSTNGNPHPSRDQSERERSLIVGCYIDVFELPHRKGKVRRLPGPAAYVRLRAGRVQIGSIEVGPNASVICFDSSRPTRSRVQLRGGQVVERFADAGINADIDSFDLREQKGRKALGGERLPS